MRNAFLGLMLVPALAGFHVLVRNGRVADAAPTHAAPDPGAVAQALTGRFRAPAARTADGTRPAIERTACAVDAPGLGDRVVYVEDAFAGRPGRPFAQRLLALDAAPGGAVRVREFALVDPEAAAGLCTEGARPTVYRSNTVAREGCDVVLRRAGAVLTGATAGDGCASRINDAHHLERTLTLSASTVEVRERGLDPSGRVVWGREGSAIRYARR